MAVKCYKLGSFGWIIRTATATPFRNGATPIDLTTLTVEAWLHPPNGKPHKVVTAGVVGGADGHVTYTVNSSDFDAVGGWRVVFWAYDISIKVHSSDYEVAISAP